MGFISDFLGVDLKKAHEENKNCKNAGEAVWDYFDKKHEQLKTLGDVFYNFCRDSDKMAALGYSKISKSVEYVGYKHETINDTVQSGYSGTVSSSGQVDLSPNYTSITTVVATPTKKEWKSEHFIKVVPFGKFSEVNEKEKLYEENYSAHCYIEQGYRTANPKLAASVVFNIFTLLASLAVLFCCIFTSSILPGDWDGRLLDIMLFGLIPGFNDIHISQILVFFVLGLGLTCLVVAVLIGFVYFGKYGLKKTYYNKMILTFLIASIIAFASLYCYVLILNTPDNSFWRTAPWVLIVALCNVSRVLIIVLSLIVFVDSIVRLCSNKQYKEANKKAEMCSVFWERGGKVAMDKLAEEIRSYNIDISKYL